MALASFSASTCIFPVVASRVTLFKTWNVGHVGSALAGWHSSGMEGGHGGSGGPGGGGAGPGPGAGWQLVGLTAQ